MLDMGCKEKRKTDEAKRSSFAAWKQHWEKRHRFYSLDEEERLIIISAFAAHDRDGDGLLTLPQVMGFLVDVGLVGSSKAERKEASRLCRIVAGEVLESGALPSGGMDQFRRLAKELRAKFGSKTCREDDDQVGTAPLYDVGLWLMPRARRVFEDLIFEDVHMRLVSVCLDDPYVPLALEFCMGQALDFGVPPHLFAAAVEAVAREGDSVDDCCGGGGGGGGGGLAGAEARHGDSGWPSEAESLTSTHAAPQVPSGPPSPLGRRKSVLGALPADASAPFLGVGRVARAIAHCREKISLLGSLRQREVQAAAELTEHDFLACRSHILRFFDRFESFRLPDKDGISVRQVWALLKEVGVVPLETWHRRNFERDLLAMGGEASCEFLSFGTVMRFVLRQREGQRRERSDAFDTCFRLVERERAGSMSLAEASQALGYFNLVPRTREAQNVVRALYAEADPEGGGRIKRDRFKTLYVRVKEELQMLHYEEGLTAALQQGMSELECRKLWQVFGEEDEDVAATAKSLGLQPVPSQDVRAARAVSTTGEAEDDDRRPVPQFADCVRAWQPPRRDTSEDVETRPRIVVRMWTPWDLRRALYFCGLPRDYVHALATADDLVYPLALHFGVDMSLYHSTEDALVAVADLTSAKCSADLFRSCMATRKTVQDPRGTFRKRGAVVKHDSRPLRDRVSTKFDSHFGL